MNVSNYSLSELMAIVDVNDLNRHDILTNTRYYIQKYKRVFRRNPKLFTARNR